MNLEDFQKSWQSQDPAKTISINADLLLNEVRRNQQQFRTTIFLRDFREVGVAALLIPVFIYMGWHLHNWTNYLVAAACFFVGGYILFDRWRRKKKSPESTGTLKACVATSLAEVRHQIWLLKNIVWWYLLPLGLPVAFSMCWPVLQRKPLLEGLIFLLGPVGVVALVYWFLYWLNQYAVKKTLKPREEELKKLLNELEAESNSNDVNTKKPLGPLLLVLAVSTIALISQADPKSPPATSGLEGIRKDYNLPALAVIVTKDGQICDRAVAGIRKWGDTTPVTTNDLFHIGSCTKSMTATLAAIFIDEGKLRWDTTIVEAFPELKGSMDKSYETVTVEQLLQHRGGLPSAPPAAAWQRTWQEIGTPTNQRREFIKDILSAPPDAPPGTKMIYSNSGYVIVGAMLEKTSRQDFESLMTEKIFKPLHMTTAGFGPPGAKGKIDQPWGHTRTMSITLPMQTDNPPVLSPAGRVHCSLDDLARYAIFHLQRGTNVLLKPETLARLHASPDGVKIKDPMDDTACGWVRLQRGWASGTALWHNGSNTMWYVVMWLAPEKNFSVIVATNIAGDTAEKACNEAATAMIHKWLPE
jgi:CubicO group peptidase (beta-lactamase class C family)